MQRAFTYVEPACPRGNLVPVSSDCVDRDGKKDPDCSFRREGRPEGRVTGCRSLVYRRIRAEVYWSTGSMKAKLTLAMEYS